jgi:hypothetical protein
VPVLALVEGAEVEGSDGRVEECAAEAGQEAAERRGSMIGLTVTMLMDPSGSIE